MDTPTYATVDGRSLAAQREAAGISLDKIAERIGSTRQALGRWERNERLPYVKAAKYSAGLHAAVADELAKVGAS